MPPQTEEQGRSGFRALSCVLEMHHRWLESNECEGSRADLRERDLRGAQLRDADLRRADLGGTDLRGSFLVGVNLEGANMGDVRLDGADLSNANLNSVRDLPSTSLARTNLRDARLPQKQAKFHGLTAATDLTRVARPIFLATVGGCVYTWLTVATTSDIKLLVGTAVSSLPIIGADIPIRGFYWFTPVALVAIYLYLHIYLQRLWEELASLPGIFPDGQRLDQKLPWMPVGLVRDAFDVLTRTRPQLARLQGWLCSGLVWWLAPLTLIPVMVRYLPKHDIFGTSFHIILFVVAVMLARALHNIALRTLRGTSWSDSPKRMRWMLQMCRGMVFHLGVPALGVLMIIFSHAMFQGKLPGLEVEHPYFYANLRRANLEGVYFEGANLYNADFGEAILSGADFRFADVRRANFRAANLRFASFHYAKMDELTNLLLADVYGADLRAFDIEYSSLLASPGRDMALYNEYDLELLRLPADHNERVGEKEPKAIRPE